MITTILKNCIEVAKATENKYMENQLTKVLEELNNNAYKINIVEKSSELAHKDLLLTVSDEIELYTTDDNGDLRYKEKYQDLFNNLYDEYYDFLSDES
jgi:hypothetical protein